MVLIVPNKGAPIILRSQASLFFDWKYDVLKFDVWKERQSETLVSPESTPVPLNLTGMSMEEGGLTSPVQGFFDVLIDTLREFKMAGDDRPLRSRVGHCLLVKNPLLYQRAGVSNFKGKE